MATMSKLVFGESCPQARETFRRRELATLVRWRRKGNAGARAYRDFAGRDDEWLESVAEQAAALAEGRGDFRPVVSRIPA